MMNAIHLTVLQALRHELFGGEKPQLDNVDVQAVLKEAEQQAVFSLVYKALKDELERLLSPAQCGELESEFFVNISNSIRVQEEHGELNDIMTKTGIPYVILKGSASAAYYPEPELRAMGDVDFLVHEKDIPRGIKALEAHGFHRDQYEFTTNQSAYHRPPMTTWEIHKSPTGIPKGKEGEPIRQALSDIIKTAQPYEHDGVKFNIPDSYHHGIILMLHKISHMTSSGIGLRHLCDWAVFESSYSNDVFVQTFEKSLRSFGVWKFAQIMTLVCEKYLGAPKRAWAKNQDVSPRQLEAIINDIFSGGNFGKKDANRIREIKYLTDRKEGKPGNKGMAAQALSSLNAKVYAEHPAIRKYRVLLPAGWTIEGGKYLGMLITGKRKNKNTTAMLKEASKRKNIYSNMELFKAE